MREGKVGQVGWEMEWMMKFCEGMIERKYQTCLRRNENNRLEKEADRKRRLRNVTDISRMSFFLQIPQTSLDIKTFSL